MYVHAFASAKRRPFGLFFIGRLAAGKGGERQRSPSFRLIESRKLLDRPLRLLAQLTRLDLYGVRRRY